MSELLIGEATGPQPSGFGVDGRGKINLGIREGLNLKSPISKGVHRERNLFHAKPGKIP